MRTSVARRFGSARNRCRERASRRTWCSRPVELADATVELLDWIYNHLKGATVVGTTEATPCHVVKVGHLVAGQTAKVIVSHNEVENDENRTVGRRWAAWTTPEDPGMTNPEPPAPTWHPKEGNTEEGTFTGPCDVWFASQRTPREYPGPMKHRSLVPLRS